MGDQFALHVDRLVSSSATLSSSQPPSETLFDFTAGELAPNHSVVINLLSPECRPATPSNALTSKNAPPCCDSSTSGFDDSNYSENAVAECRICQEEEDVAKLENPCACSGSVKYAHRKCVQRWCNEKGDTICEICQQPYKSGYTAPPAQTLSNDVSIDFSDDWNTHRIELDDSRLLAMAAAQRRFLDAEYEEVNSSSAACCRSAALILMALLLLRHAIAMAAASADDDTSMFFTLFVLRVAGFLLPCYIMARAMNMLQRRRQRQEAAIAAAEVTILLQAGQARGINFSLPHGQPQTSNLYSP